MDLSNNHQNNKDLIRILGNKKEIKINEFYQMLKGFNLTSFDLEEQMMKHFFEGNAFSINKLDTIMKNLGLPVLNTKDK